MKSKIITFLGVEEGGVSSEVAAVESADVGVAPVDKFEVVEGSES